MKSSYLFTFFGTIVYLDTEASILKHGDVRVVTPNVTMEWEGDTGSLWYHLDGHRRPISEPYHGLCRFVPDDPTPLPMRLTQQNSDRTAFTWSGRVLTAEADGVVTLFRDAIGNWEIFYLLDRETLDELRFILCNAWVQRAPSQVIQSAEINGAEGFHVSFAGILVHFDELLRLIRGPQALRPSRALEIQTTFDGWKVLFLRLYRPLLYLVAYGADEIFRCCDMAISSLRDFGSSNVEIALITDWEHAKSYQATNPDIIPVAIAGSDTLDFALARYKIIDIEAMRSYQPIVYIDTDVVANAPFDGLLRELCFTDDLYVIPEGDLLVPEDHYGRTLFEADQGVALEGDKGFSSGLLAFRNVAIMHGPFSRLLASAYGFARLAMKRDYFPAFDQPFANYIYRKSFVLTQSLEQWAAVSSYYIVPMTDAASRLGFIHFAGGVGNATPKIDRMRSYIEALSAPQLESDDVVVAEIGISAVLPEYRDPTPVPPLDLPGDSGSIVD